MQNLLQHVFTYFLLAFMFEAWMLLTFSCVPFFSCTPQGKEAPYLPSAITFYLLLLCLFLHTFLWNLPLVSCDTAKDRPKIFTQKYFTC